MAKRRFRSRPLRVPFHRKLQALWLTAHVFLVYALIAQPSLTRLALALVWCVLVNVGSEAGAHRYFAHRSYATTPFRKNLMVFLQTFAGEGSVLAFCGVHRQHHAHADQELDPHSPVHKSSLSITYWLKTIHVNVGSVRDCLRDPIVSFQHEQYFKLQFLIFAICLCTVGLVNYGYFFCLPIVLIHYGNAATNILGHRENRGYRSFETRDRSVNVGGFVNVLLMGGGMQNNHHQFPRHYTVKVRPDEHDSMGWIIQHLLRTGVSPHDGE